MPTKRPMAASCTTLALKRAVGFGSRSEACRKTHGGRFDERVEGAELHADVCEWEHYSTGPLEKSQGELELVKSSQQHHGAADDEAVVEHAME
ncbi:hypothetical protein BM221_009729 [Beauveria bassiana]|uniref:Uncharacterized protein n=1 Tax=Beauveria bassiana TaxID=176275 RepID=A0A2N6NAN9_BEABA|nr:hypothetical protein BM221_009729 [Beauveria bassiana]